MNLQISYDELKDLISEKAHQDVELCYVNEKTIEICKEIKVLLVRKTVSVYIEVKQIVGNDMIVSYKAGTGLEMMAKGVLLYFKDVLGNIVEEIGSNTLTIHLDNIDKLQQSLSIIEIKDIEFNNVSAALTLKLRKK